MTEEQKRQLQEFLERGCSDDDLCDYIEEHGLNARDVWLFEAELYAPEYCKGCKHILCIYGERPCTRCSRGRTDMYEKRE